MEEKLVKLTFKQSGEEYYFGSYAAIFKKFTSEKLHVSLGTIWNTIKRNNGKYENDTISIITTTFMRSKRG